MTKIYILAQSPAIESNEDFPLYKTKSKARLDQWLDETLDPNKLYVIKYANAIKLLDQTKYTTNDLVRVSKDIFDFEADKVLALGKVAGALLDEIQVKHIKLEHPSGLNRNLNDKDYEARMLAFLKEYINE